jgi:hypothetical protein
MRLIRYATCIDNIDPKGIGRIRFIELGSNIGEKEGTYNYEPWDSRDIFVAQPFLPPNINFIPEKGQIVKIFSHDTETNLNNQEYIAGPFTTIHDFNSQTVSKQLENTSYGASVKHTPDIFDKNGNYIKEKSIGSLSKPKDYAIYGKYGSDILFTENGINIRSGKYPDKEGSNAKTKRELLSYPQISDKRSILSLKKFTHKKELIETTNFVTEIEKSNLKYIIEYDLNNLNNPTEVQFYVYKVVKPYGSNFRTDLFNTTTYEDISLVDYKIIKLINEQNDGTSPSFIINVSSQKESYIKIRNIISSLGEKGLNNYNSILPQDNIFPFFFRPTMYLKTRIRTYKNNFIQNIKVSGVETRQGSGLYYSLENPKPKINRKPEVIKQLKIVQNRKEQTFGSITSDKIYLLSTDTNSKKPIDFKTLDKYEYTQNNYLERIDPNTYSLVRGENLIKVIRALYDVIFTHRHNINKSIIGQQEYNEGNKLKELIKTLESDILNNSIRIN